MPFVPDSTFERKEKIEVMNEAILKKKEQAYITDQAKEAEPKKPLKIDNAKVIKQLLKNTNMAPKDKPKPITLKEIKDSLKINQIIEEEKVKEIEEILDSVEITEVKGEFVNVLAMAHTHPIKRQIFSNKLQNSKTINNFVDNNIILRIFNRANENIKFAVVYRMKYLETNKDYETLLVVQKLREEQAKKQQEAKEEVKKEIKEEVKKEVKTEVKEEVKTEVKEEVEIAK